MDNSQANDFLAKVETAISFFTNTKTMLSDHEKRIWWNALKQFDYKAVTYALDRHCIGGRFKPKPVDIIDIIVANDGRPDSEVAWSLALRVEDENETIIWTDEIASAWSIAKPLLDHGEVVGARMAFKQAYEKLVMHARQVGRPVNHSVSLGFDAERRNEVIANAIQQGLIKESYGSTLMLTDMSEGGKSLAGLIGFSSNAVTDKDFAERNREHIAKLRKDIARMTSESEEKRQAIIKEATEKLHARREELLRQQEELLAKARKNYGS